MPARSAVNLVLTSAASLACGVLFYHALSADSYSRQMIGLALRGESPAQAAPLKDIDTVARSAADRAGPGNLLVSPDSDPRAVSILHPRAVYTLWPTRLYAVDPSIVVLHSEQIGPATRPSDPRWLADRNVRSRIHFGLRNGRLTIEQIDPVAAP